MCSLTIECGLRQKTSGALVDTIISVGLLCHGRSRLPYTRSILPYNRSLLPHTRSLLPYDRFLVSWYRSLLPFTRSLLPYAQVAFATCAHAYAYFSDESTVKCVLLL
jgi:hypothetical protein